MLLPTMVASFFGMNVPVPWEGDPMGFVIVSIVALGLTIVSIWVLWKKRLF